MLGICNIPAECRLALVFKTCNYVGTSDNESGLSASASAAASGSPRGMMNAGPHSLSTGPQSQVGNEQNGRGSE